MQSLSRSGRNASKEKELGGCYVVFFFFVIDKMSPFFEHQGGSSLEKYLYVPDLNPLLYF